MILYIDETESDDYFIVAGLLTSSKAATNLTYKHFKKKLRSMKISDKEKQRIFYEFKAVLLDRHYQRIKIKMLEELQQLDHKIIYTTYCKKDNIFNQKEKEKQYIKMLNKIVHFIKNDVDIIFDSFNKCDFENRIITEISLHNHVLSICSKESFAEEGLQFIDNICSCIRLYKSNLNKDFYQMIETNIIELEHS